MMSSRDVDHQFILLLRLVRRFRVIPIHGFLFRSGTTPRARYILLGCAIRLVVIYADTSFSYIGACPINSAADVARVQGYQFSNPSCLQVNAGWPLTPLLGFEAASDTFSIALVSSRWPRSEYVAMVPEPANCAGVETAVETQAILSNPVKNIQFRGIGVE